MIRTDHLICFDSEEQVVKCTKKEIRRLKTALRWKGHPQQRQRIQMVLLRENGMTQPAIAESMGVSRSTVNRAHMAYVSIPAIPISRSRRSRSPIPIDPDQCGAGCVRAPLDAFSDFSVAFRCQVRREPVPVVNRRD